MSFSSKKYLEQKTGPSGLGRFQYLQALVTEFQDTHKHEHKLQVLANLANFAYDPINYEYFRQLNILDLFLDVVAEELDEKMVEFAMGGICNCCLDKLNKSYFVENEAVELTVKCLARSWSQTLLQAKISNEETVLSAITTLMFLTTPETKKDTTADNIVQLMKQFAESANTRLHNLATIFLEDYCELPAAGSRSTTQAQKRKRV